VSTISANSGQNPVAGTSYNVWGLPTGVTLGSGDSDSFNYDANTGRMTQYQFNVGSPVQSVVGVPTWNSNGTLGQLAITDPFDSANQQTCKYVYDDLARAASVNCTLNPSGSGNWSQTFSFDPFGNIDKTGNNGGTSFQPTYTSNPSTNRYATLPGGTPAYDTNGNVQADGFHNYAWDADGNSVSIDTTGLTFDALDRMVEQNSGGSYTQFVYAPQGSKMGIMNGQTVYRVRVPLPGNEVAIFANNPTTPSLVRYWHQNWRGDLVFNTTSTQTFGTDDAYAPYGEPYAETLSTGQIAFANLPSDTYGDLYDALYREYHPTQGRWVSPDPAGLAAVNPANPQSWNRYAYVTNNPLALIDPLGLDPAACQDPMYASSHAECANDPVCEYFSMECGGPWGIPPGPAGGRGGSGGQTGGGSTSSRLPGNADFGVTCTQVSVTIGSVSYPGGPIQCTVILSSGFSLPNININDLLAALDSAYGSALGKAGQVFRGRPPGMSYNACMAQNSQLMGASAATAMVGLGSYLTPGSIGGVTVPLPASYVWLFRGIAAVGDALGVPASEAGAGYVLGAAAGLSTAGAVLGSAGFGWLVGSAANCASEGVNP